MYVIVNELVREPRARFDASRLVPVRFAVVVALVDALPFVLFYFVDPNRVLYVVLSLLFLFT